MPEFHKKNLVDAANAADRGDFQTCKKILEDHKYLLERSEVQKVPFEHIVHITNAILGTLLIIHKNLTLDRKKNPVEWEMNYIGTSMGAGIRRIRDTYPVLVKSISELAVKSRQTDENTK